MSSGTISGNNAPYAGGVHIEFVSCVVDINGGSIRRNSASFTGNSWYYSGGPSPLNITIFTRTSFSTGNFEDGNLPL